MRLLTTGPGREALAGLLYKSLSGLFAQPEALPVAPAEVAQDDPVWEQLVAQLRTLRPHAIVVIGRGSAASCSASRGRATACHQRRASASSSR